MIEVKFFPIDIDRVEEENNVVIRIFGRTIDGKRICVLDKSFKPYFWVLPEKNIDLSKLADKIKRINFGYQYKIIKVLDVELHKKNYLGKPVDAIKVFVRSPKEIGLVREFLKAIKGIKSEEEYDIPFCKKYLIENKIIPLSLCKVEGSVINANLDVDICIKGKVSQETNDIIQNPKILSLDIETANPALPIQDVDAPIIMLGLVGTNGFKKCITWKRFKTSKKEIEFVTDETKLLIRFRDIIKMYKPDYMVGYYSDGFDWPYIKSRADFLKINLDLGLDKSKIRFNRKGNSSSVKINGIPHIDVYRFIKQIMSGDVASGSLQTQSYSLDSVAEEILEENKIPVDILKLNDAWKNNEGLEEFCLYNIKDSELCLKIFERILPNINELVKVVSQSIYDVSKMTFGQLIENYLMKKTRDFNEIIPRRPTFGERENRAYNTYTGGFVYEPKPGLYENLAVFDFRGLHPSIISAYNICLSTLTDNKKNANESPEINGKKYYFSYKEDGFIPQIIRELIERRIRIKEIIKKSENEDPVLKARSYALKIIAAGFHGYMGYSGARWYSVECAAGILAYARFYIKKLISQVEKAGFNVIYGDTDSVFIELGDKSKEDALRFLRAFNNELPSLMELELESFYERGIFVGKKSVKAGAKKKYALINKEGKIKIRGFEKVRGDWSYISRDIQNKVFEFVLKDKDSQKALDYVKQKINQIKNKELDIEEMIIKIQLKKNIDEYELVGPHVAVARQMLKKNIKVGPGSVIQFIITEGEGLIRDKAKLVEDATDYDADYYINHQVLPTVEKIFEVLDYKKEDLLGNKDQFKLKHFIK